MTTGRPPLMHPIRPLFAGAVVFGGLVRLVDLFVLSSTTRAGFVQMWQGREELAFALSDGVRVCCLLFLLVAFVELLLRPRSLAGWACFAFCGLLAVYGCGLDIFTDEMEPWSFRSP